MGVVGNVVLCSCCNKLAINGCLDIIAFNAISFFFIYLVRNCMHYLGEVVLVKPAYFQHKRCVYMQKPTNFRFNVGFSSCVVNQMFHIEPINGNEAEILSTTVGGPFRISTSRLKDNQNNFCLQVRSVIVNVPELFSF